MSDVVIVSACRSPLGKFGGALKDVSAVELGQSVVKEALARAQIDGQLVDEVIFGNVLAAGLGQNPAAKTFPKITSSTKETEKHISGF